MAALAGEYLLLGAEFVAAVQVIVYAGAIMVLFVFVIMLLNAGEEERHQGQPGRDSVRRPRNVDWAACWWRGSCCGIRERRRSPIGALPGDPKDIGQLLFHEFLLPFEVTSVLILIAIMGAVVLASKPASFAGREGGLMVPLCPLSITWC